MKKMLPILAIILGVFLLFGEKLYPPPGKIIYGWDLAGMVYFVESYFTESIKSGIIPFWNPYNFSGTPFLSHPFTAPFYPFNLIYIIFPLNLAFSVYLFVHISLAGVFMYWFMRKKTDRISSLVSAMVFALSGFVAARIYSGHVQYISAYAWIPLVFGSIERALESKKKKDILPATAALTLQILNGVHLMVIFTLELVSLYVIFKIISYFTVNPRYRVFSTRPGSHNFIKTEIKISFSGGPAARQPQKHPQGNPVFGAPRLASPMLYIVIFFIILIASLGLSAVQILPGLELSGMSLRNKGLPYDIVTWGSGNWATLKLFLSPYQLGNPFPESYSYFGPGPNFFEFTYYVGIIPIILLLLYILMQILNIIVRKKAEPNFFFYLLSLSFFVLVSIGSNSPFHKWIYNLVPLYKSIRIPVRHLVIVVFLLARISGVTLSKIRVRWVRILMLILICAELLSFNKLFIRLADLPTASFDQNLVRFLQKNTSDGRLLPYYGVSAKTREVFDLTAANYYKIPSTGGNDPLILGSYRQLLDAVNKTKEPSLLYYNIEEIPLPIVWSSYLDFLNVKYILVDPLSDPIGKDVDGRLKRVLEGKGYRLYENLKVLPRFFLVGKADSFETVGEVQDAVIAQKADLAKTVLLVQKDIRKLEVNDRKCDGKNPGEVKINSYNPNRIILDIKTQCDRFLSSSEVYYPGWQAKIDGIETEIYRSNIAFRSLFVPEGEHKVEFYFRGDIFILGGIISLLTGLILVVIYWLRYP